MRERLDLLAQIAELDEAALGDDDHALAVYEKMLELDAGRSARAPRARSALRRARALARSREPAGHAGRLRVRRPRCRSWSSGAPSCAPATSTTSPARSTCSNRSSRPRPTTRARAACSRSWSRCPEHRQRVAKILEPVYEASGAWARLAAILDVEREALEGPAAAALLARIADLQENKLQARAAALATWRQVLAADPGNPDALAEIERLGDGAGALLRAGRRLSGAGVQARRRPTSRGAPICCRGRRSCTRGASATGAPRSTSGSWSSTSIPSDADTTAPAAAALETLYTETGDVAGLVKILRHAGALGRRRRAARKKILFRIAELQEKSLGDIDAAVATLRSILEIDPAGARRRSTPSSASSRRARSTASASRCCASASTWPATRRRARSCGGASRACSSATSATSTRRSPPASASSTRTRRTTRRWRRWRASTSSRGATASGWRSSSGAWRSQGRARRRAGRAAAADRGAAGRAARRSGRRARALARGAGGGARRPRSAGGAGALPGARHRRRPAAGGGAGAGADLRERPAASPSWRRWCASTSRRRPTRARASSS